MTWARKRAVDVHDETADYLSAEYASDKVYDSPFRYGRALIDEQWNKVVEGLMPRANCLDIGSGIGTYLAQRCAGLRWSGCLVNVCRMAR